MIEMNSVTTDGIQEIQQKMDKYNQIQDLEFPVISSVEWSHFYRKLPERNFKSRNKEIIDKWRVDYTVPNQYIDPNRVTVEVSDNAQPEQSKYNPTYKAGDRISSIQAMGHEPGSFGLDIRPNYDYKTSLE